MIPLQEGIDSLNIVQPGDQGYGVWFTIEIVLIIGVIIYQFYISGRIYKNINQLKEIFRNRLSVISGYIERSNLNKNETSIKDIVFTDSGKDTSSDDKRHDRKIGQDLNN